MKILVLNGSPKGEKSDTMCMTRAFLDGMNSVSENIVKTIDVQSKHIEYCLGDMSCMRNGGKCVHNDDMAQIIDDITKTDLLLFSFPLYYYGIPAPLKALLDRTLPLNSMAMKKVGDRYQHISQADCSHLRCAMISGCGFPNAKHNFDALRLQFQILFSESVFMLTVSESPLFNIPQADMVTKPFLELVSKAGAEYAKKGAVSEELMDKLSVPMIPEEEYAAGCNSEV